MSEQCARALRWASRSPYGTTAALLVAWLRRFTITGALVATALIMLPWLNAAGWEIANGPVSDVADAAAFVIAFALGSERPWFRSLIGLVPLIVAVEIPTGEVNPFLLVMTIGPWLAGLLLASRKRTADRLARRARELAEERELFAVASVRYERARIARELHDVVAHSVSIMVVQANAGSYLVGNDPAGAARAFEAISDTADQAQAEIDRLATLLDPSDPAEPPGLAIIDQLVVRARTAGLHVSYHAGTDGSELAQATVDVILRVTQEAITNALKHAPGAPIRISLNDDDGAVVLRVDNERRSHEGTYAVDLHRTGGGRGLAGMAARVNESGGQFAAGAGDAGGWQVEARLPRTGRVAAASANASPRAPV